MKVVLTVLKGVLHIILCYVLLCITQPFMYKFAGYLGSWYTSGWFEVVSYGIGLGVFYGIFALICTLIAGMFGTKASAVISTIICAVQIVYYQIRVVHFSFYDSMPLIIASWLPTIAGVIVQSVQVIYAGELNEK